MFEEEDDIDFVTAGRSKLASVFGLEKPKENGNPSLVYTPQKKPKPVEQASGSPPVNAAQKPQASMSKFTVIIADIVHSFKLEGDNYTDQKKVGIAVLGNPQAHVFQVLLYRTTPGGKQDYIAVAKINNDFRFLVQPKLYCSFYDDARNYWSLVFTNPTSCMQFSRQVGAAHFRAILGKEVVTQMIDVGEEGIFEGDTTHLTISQQYFDINSILQYNPMEASIKLSINPSLAKWSEGLVSARPGSKWAIFIPALTPLPWASQVSQSPLALEVVVEKMLQTMSPTLPTHPGNVVSGPDEGSVQAKGASIAESLSSNVSSTKASLISRVARVGQATLPLKGAVFSNPTDSEDTEEEASSITSTNTVKPPGKPKFFKPRSSARHLSSESDQAYSAKQSAPVASTLWRPAALYSQSENKLVQYVSGDGQIMAMPSTTQQYQLVGSSPVTSPSEPMSLFISESRIQNTEMRMNMNRIIDKIENLSTKVDGISSSNSTPAATPSSGAMDAGSLLSSIEKLFKDNQSLTAEVAEKTEKLNEANERIFTLVNAKILEENRTLLEEKRRAATEAVDAQLTVTQKLQIESLEKEKATLVEKVAELEKRLTSLQDCSAELSSSKDFELNAKEGELSAKVSELKDKDSQLENIRTILAAKEEELKAAIAELHNQRSSIEQIDNKVKDAENKADRYEADNAELKDLVTSLSMNISELETTIANLTASQQEEKTAYESQKKTYDETIAQLKSELASKGQHDYDAVVMDLKVLMNKVFRKISQYFDGTGAVNSAVVRQTVAVVLKSEVTQYTEELLLKKNGPPLKTEETKSTTVSEVALPKNNPVVEPVKSPHIVHSTNSSQPAAAAAVDEGRSQPQTGETVHPQSEFGRSEPPPVPNFEEEDDTDYDNWLNKI